MNSRSAQLTLALFTPPRVKLDDHLGESSAALRAALTGWAQRDAHWCIGLWGQRGVGKTHLLQGALCAAHDAAAMYIPLREVMSYGPSILQDLERIDVIAIDDIDCVAGDRAWEEALFALYNAVGAMHGRIAFAASYAPAQLSFALADLKSRLSSALIYQVNEPLEAEKIEILHALAKTRGLVLNSAVVNFLLRRLPRDLHALVSALDRLDIASLSEGRALTIPFVREILNG